MQISFYDLYTEFQRYGAISSVEGDRPEITIVFRRSDSLNELKLYEPEIVIQGHKLRVEWLNDDFIEKEETQSADELLTPDSPREKKEMHVMHMKPPEHHKYSEILNKLDDKLMKIFFKWTSMSECDLQAMANSRKQKMKPVMTQSYHLKANGDLRNLPDICGRPLWCVENFFRNFGECVVRLSSMWLSDIQCRMVMEFCPNIDELKCSLFDRQTTEKIRPLVARLRVLEVHYHGDEMTLGEWYGGNFKLERLTIIMLYGRIIRLPGGKIPSLKEVTFSNVPMNRADAFFANNQQLEKVTFVRVLDEQNPHMHKTSFKQKKDLNQRHTLEQIDDIFKYLKYCKVVQFYNEEDGVYTRAMEACVKRQVKIPVEYLKIHQDEFLSETQCVEHLCRLITLKRLNIKEIALSDDDLKAIATSLTNLEELTIWSNSDSANAPKMSGIRHFMNYAKEKVLKKVLFILQASNGDNRNPLDVNELEVATEIASAMKIDFQVHLYSQNDVLNVADLAVSMVYGKMRF